MKNVSMIGIKIANMGICNRFLRQYITFQNMYYVPLLCVCFQRKKKEHLCTIHHVEHWYVCRVNASIHLFEKFPLTNKLSTCHLVKVHAGHKRKKVEDQHNEGTAHSPTDKSSWLPFFLSFVVTLFFVLLVFVSTSFSSFFH